MGTKTIQVYKFSELSEEAKEKAIDAFRGINTDYEWWKWAHESWQERLRELGYDDVDISFSGFSSQGDGASFTARIDIQTWLKSHKKVTQYNAVYKDVDNCSIVITKSGHYAHEMTMSVDCEYSGDNTKAYNTIDALGDEILEDAREYARMIYKELEQEYDGLRADEAVIETIESNEYDFLEDGSRQYFV